MKDFFCQFDMKNIHLFGHFPCFPCADPVYMPVADPEEGANGADATQGQTNYSLEIERFVSW